MSLTGEIEDVPIVDVLQFIHLGTRTGMLVVKSRGRQATIGLHRGRIVSAAGANSRRLGDLLIRNKLLTDEQLVDVLHQQQAEQPRRSLGAILMAERICTDAQIQHAIEEQIEHTVYEIVSWNTGSFEFLLDELEPLDDIGLFPGDIIPRVDLNTQMVILHAMQVFDERNRKDASNGTFDSEPERPLSNPQERAVPDETSMAPDPVVERPSNGHTELAQSSATIPLLPVLQVVTRDDSLIDTLRKEIPAKEARVTKVRLRGAGSVPPGHAAPVVLIDVRQGVFDASSVASLRRARPRAAILTVIDSNKHLHPCYRAGALAVLPDHPAIIAASFASVLRNRCDQSSEAVISRGMREGFARLRRVFGDLRSGFMSATMSLNLMSIVSESTERAVLFLVQRRGLAVLGAFGFGAGAATLADLTKGMVLPISESNALSDCLTAGRVQQCTYQDAALPAQFQAVLGPPRSSQVAIFPVLGGRRVIAVVYTDNGTREAPLQEVELLSLATSQVGVAFENELLRRQIAQAGTVGQ